MTRFILGLPLAGLVAVLLLTAGGCGIDHNIRHDDQNVNVHHDPQHIYIHFGRRKERRVQ